MEPPQPPPAPGPEFEQAILAFDKAMAQGNAEQAEGAAANILGLAAEWAEQNPSPELVLMNEAGQCERTGDWSGAESRFQQLVAMAEAASEMHRLAHAQLKLCSLFLLLNRPEPARAAADAAAAAALKSNLCNLQVAALEMVAVCALRRSDLAEALRAAEEAVSRVEGGTRFDHLRAGAWVTRARSLAALGDQAGTERDLLASKPFLIDREISPIMAGVLGKAAGWWEVSATLSSLRGDLGESVKAWSQAVELRRHISALGHVAGPHTLMALARSLEGRARGLVAAGRCGESEVAFAEAARLRRELGVPGTETA
jgi:tetratricopeptide (TPR) repeat protein